MSLRSLEAAILAELKQVAGRKSIRQKDIQEWSSGPVTGQTGETVYHLPSLSVNVAVLDSALGKASS